MIILLVYFQLTDIEGQGSKVYFSLVFWNLRLKKGQRVTQGALLLAP